ncbi:radical SAM protein [Streptomyces lavendulocolor]|uniref:radical SAM protein n=1 Tax=Streptomyces lavendulocolor TaxID=67316 RepID=UPI0033DF973E
MTTAIHTSPGAPAPSGLLSVECEISGNCQLECAHCCTLSGPKVDHGTMTLDDWRTVVDDTAELGIPTVQFIGGEPTRSVYLLPLISHALGRGLEVEVYSNLVAVRRGLWRAFEQDGVRLATSYYSDRAAEHDRITGVQGSHELTRRNIVKALGLGIRLRIGIVRVSEDQRTVQAEDELRTLGVTEIRIDRTRGVGRAAAGSTTIPGVSELCGRCFHHRLAVSPDGTVYGCILSRFLPVGDVRRQGLAAIVSSEEWARARASIPAAMDAGCPPDDSSDCNPANTTACDPAY